MPKNYNIYNVIIIITPIIFVTKEEEIISLHTICNVISKRDFSTEEVEIILSQHFFLLENNISPEKIYTIHFIKFNQIHRILKKTNLELEVLNNYKMKILEKRIINNHSAHEILKETIASNINNDNFNTPQIVSIEDICKINPFTKRKILKPIYFISKYPYTRNLLIKKQNNYNLLDYLSPIKKCIKSLLNLIYNIFN